MATTEQILNDIARKIHENNRMIAKLATVLEKINETMAGGRSFAPVSTPVCIDCGKTLTWTHITAFTEDMSPIRVLAWYCPNKDCDFCGIVRVPPFVSRS